MPASWAFSSGSSTPSSRISSPPEAPHREETQISERSCPFGQGSTSKNRPAFEKNEGKSRGKREAKASEQSGFVNHQDGSSRDVDRKASVTAALFPSERRREAAGRSRRALREAQPADVRGFAPESHQPS